MSSVRRDENHPLLRLDSVEPHSMILIIRPHNPRNNTVIRSESETEALLWLNSFILLHHYITKRA